MRLTTILWDNDGVLVDTELIYFETTRQVLAEAGFSDAEVDQMRHHYHRPKPDPEPYLLAVAKLGVEPENCLVIEDSERGLRAAKAAGMTCWRVRKRMQCQRRSPSIDWRLTWIS